MSAETSASPGDYVECMYLMLQNESADDYVIGTGESHSVREFCFGEPVSIGKTILLSMTN